jgi:uncharacterized Zn finger protein (UPF0148 family)
MTRKICCKCGLPGNQGLDGKWYCDVHFQQLKADPNVHWGAIKFDGKRRKAQGEK